MVSESVRQDETLDPADWEEFRALGHRMVDDMTSLLQGIRDTPVWQPMPDAVRDHFKSSVPVEGKPLEEVYDDFVNDVAPYRMGNIHPRFWGWVMGTGAPVGVLADFLASALNPNMGGADHSGPEVEKQVIEWCKQMLGYPQEASGLLVTGGSMANFIALAVARNAKAGYDIRKEGVAAASRPLTMYCSSETHSSVQRAVELLGLGNDFLRSVPVDKEYRMDTAALRAAIEADLTGGLQPVCVVGNAGTTNTGATDPLDEIADIAAEYGLWYHVDGAFGALAYLSPDLRPLVKGMERADSLAFDLHKWFFLPMEVGCTLVRDRDAHRRTFALRPDYLKHAERGLASASLWFSDYDIQLTRNFRALKVWMAFKAYGTEAMGRMIRQNVEQAHYLTSLVEASPQLELLAPAPLNIVNFRMLVPGRDDAWLNAFNEDLLGRLQESGVAVPSSTMLEGQYAIRCSLTNHRTRREDLDILVDAVIKLGDEMLAEGWQPAEG